jgi:flagellar motor switch/type III secretory pathway protein FliN
VTVTSFDLGACPRVSTRTARALRAALPGIAALPPRWDVELGPLGPTAVRVAAVAPPRPGARASAAAIALPIAAGPDAGRLTIDVAFGARLVDAAIGGPSAVVAPRPLGPAESGVLAALLGGALAPIGVGIGLGQAVAPDGAASMVLTIETRAAAGTVALELANARALARGGRPLPPGAAARLPVLAGVVLAVTRVRASAFMAAGAGDAVVFDGVRADAFGAGAAWPAELAIGPGSDGWALPVLIDAGGTMTVTGRFRPRREEGHMEGNTDGKTEGMTLPARGGAAADADAEATAVLAAAPVEVVAELGRVTLRGDEVLGLAPGAVLALGAGRGAISLRVGGARWAEGEIVDVDGELGVRVTRLVRP